MVRIIIHGAVWDYVTNFFLSKQEKAAIEEALYGPRTPLTQSEYKQIFQATGLDIDGRREFICSFVPAMGLVVEELIDWVKGIPGFNDLSPTDQVKMLKGTIRSIYIYIS